MIQVITHKNAANHTHLLRGMHRDRKAVFIDGLGWDLHVHADDLEIDQFDNEDAVYIIVSDDDTGCHLGSLRLLPTTKPHLLTEVFSHLCAEGPIVDPKAWEISRFCLTPSHAKDMAVRRLILLGLVEYALAYGITRYTCVTHMSFLTRLLAVGWECEPLGLPGEDRGGQIGALLIKITPETLTALQRSRGIFAPVLPELERVVA